ncbi:MAG: hypothetical protein HYY76_07025 [Acidobacteria bacterium]|nr:hypothetical protein [Acidobacteriota bacterium]
MPRPRPAVLAGLFLVFLAGAGEAATWHVKADAAPGGDGSRARPFATLEEVENASRPGDTIRVLPATRPLGRGIQLKDNQRLIGDGDAVTAPHRAGVRDGGPATKAPPGGARPTITNSTSARHHGDAIRLANGNLVQNIHVDGAARAAVFGVNAARAQIRGNLITNNMIQGNDLRRLERPWPDGFILYESQTNHFGGITMLACGPGASSYCTMHAPERPAAPTTGEIVIAGNVIRDSNLEGIMLITDTGAAATFTVTDTIVRDLSQGLPPPESFTPPVDIVRSRAFTLIALNHSRVDLTMSRFLAENVAPPGRYAADGLVFLTGGDGPVVNAKVSQFTMLNPKMTGEMNNGDSIEIQHRGSSNAVLNIDMSRLDLRDPASANIKILEASNPTNGTYNLTVSDSVLSNNNPAGGLDGQIRLSGASNGTKAFTLVVRNTRFVGIGGAIGILNPNNVETLTVMVENSSMSGFTHPAGAKPIAAVTMTHPADKTIGKAVLDLGGGPLGSRGRNRFVNNPWLDISVTNASPKTAVQVDASNNYWGGGAPVLGQAPPGDVAVSGNTKFNAPAHLTADPAR